MTPQGQLQIAEYLVGTEPTPVLPRPDLLRAAIGRFYFAAFLAARDHVEATTFQPVVRDVTAHGWVPRQFAGQDTPSQTVRKQLHDLRELRNGADYGEPMDEEVAVRSARKKARAVLSALATLKVRAR